MKRIIETEVMTFDELGDVAKEKARAWFREGGFDFDWYDFTLSAAHDIGQVLGFTIPPAGKGKDGIAFSGFSNQGDGASFSGMWEAPTDPVARMEKLGFTEPAAGKLIDLAYQAEALAATLEDPDEVFLVERSGRYCHEMTMQCYNDEVLKLARAFARWIYSSLQATWDDINSDESVDEAILANEYTFKEDGSRFG